MAEKNLMVLNANDFFCAFLIMCLIFQFSFINDKDCIHIIAATVKQIKFTSCLI